MSWGRYVLQYGCQRRPWSDLSMSLRLKLTKNYTFNMNASFATYAMLSTRTGMW